MKATGNVPRQRAFTLGGSPSCAEAYFLVQPNKSAISSQQPLGEACISSQLYQETLERVSRIKYLVYCNQFIATSRIKYLGYWLIVNQTTR
jgi:hypothetical protein